MTEETLIKSLLNIPSDATLQGLIRNPRRRGGKTYVYLSFVYRHQGKMKKVHVPRGKEEEIRRLWEKRQGVKEKIRGVARKLLDLVPANLMDEARELILEQIETLVFSLTRKASEKETEELVEENRLFLESVLAPWQEHSIPVSHLLFIFASLEGEEAKNLGVETIKKRLGEGKVKNFLAALVRDLGIEIADNPHLYLLSGEHEELILSLLQRDSSSLSSSSSS